MGRDSNRRNSNLVALQPIVSNYVSLNSANARWYVSSPEGASEGRRLHPCCNSSVRPRVLLHCGFEVSLSSVSQAPCLAWLLQEGRHHIQHFSLRPDEGTQPIIHHICVGVVALSLLTAISQEIAQWPSAAKSPICEKMSVRWGKSKRRMPRISVVCMAVRTEATSRAS